MESVPIGTNSGVDTHAKDFSFMKGDLYESKEKLIHAIHTYSIAKNVKFRPTKNNTTSYNVVCFYRKDDDVEDNSGHHDGNARCPWKLNSRSGARVGGQFKITAYNGLHTCSNPRLEMNNKNASSSFIYRLILPHLREDLDLRPKDIRLLVHKATNLDVSYHKCWNARRKAMIKIFEDWDNSYEILPHYLEALKRENLGIVYEVSSDPVDGGERRFTGVFWAFGPCIEGFRYCRPLLSIDGTHLYGKYKGVLLVATGVDADGGLFPLAFVVVDVENTENWAWFFACIRYHIPSVGTRPITFISDRMKGIPRALQRHFPPPHAHRYCLRHIRDNFKKKYGNAQVQDLLWQAGCATEKYVYEQIRERIKFISRAAHDWIETSLGPNNVDKWALCEDGGRRFCMMTTNTSESFNGVLRGACDMPIQTLVAKTFYRLNKFFVRHRELGENIRSELTPKVDEMLAARIVQARSFQVVRYSFNEWEVLEGITHRENRSYKVNMLVDHTCTCTCNVPQLQLIPCSHVVAACSDLQGGARISHYEFVDAWYSAYNYQQTYKECFRPPYDSRHWTQDGPRILPPLYKRSAGRPRSVRIRNSMNDGREGARRRNKCSRCLFIMDPGPENPDVLYLQASHCSDHIGSGEPVPEFTMIEHSQSHSAWVIKDERVLLLIAQAGFRPCSTIRYIRLDWPLITALIERWRPETNSFHMHIGKCTITLQDVAVILGLRIDGPVVTGTDDHSWPGVCARLLGQVPDLRSGAMKLSWLRQTF
ncbi:uncharacterized protein LOC109827508 [Asparagus officinalis]|uniref:uncharacterized protein LOC109827508 n=1 Tax=Asparagus officinalis TaxID=4686 RepID=UPI00098E545C|nr:uncharacterized protein LOC109827508 [Asparagus officinalis]